MDTSGPGPLITAVELRSRLGGVTLLDVRYRMGGPGGPDEYAGGHLPGAVYVDLDLDLAGPPAEHGQRGGRHPLPEPFRFVHAMRAAGVDNARPVVVYDDWAGRAAGRCWWLLRHYGHGDVRVLDGGLAAWRGAGGELVGGAHTVAEGDFSGAPGHLAVLEAEDVPAFDGVLVDARDPERFRGEREPVDPVAGHIPGAVNVPTGANLAEDGTFLAAAQLRALYPDGPLAAYCGSGVTATHDLLALGVLGVEGALYAGSWSDWVSDPERPVSVDG